LGKMQGTRHEGRQGFFYDNTLGSGGLLTGGGSWQP
jgi:hypothetical protein